MTMGNQDFQDLDRPEGFGTQKSNGSNLQSLAWWAHHARPHVLPAQIVFSGIQDTNTKWPHGESLWFPRVENSAPGPSMLLEELLPEAGLLMAFAPGGPNHSIRNGFTQFSNDPICAIDAPAAQDIAARHDDPHHGRDKPSEWRTSSPSTQWRNVQLSNPCDPDPDPDPTLVVSQGQSSRRRSEGTSGTGPHPISISPFQCRDDQASEALERIDSGCPPSTRSPQGAPYLGRASPEWHCGACRDKKYGRAQDLKRHIRDKHQLPQECPFCRIKWTRPEKIRKHLIAFHRGLFTEAIEGEISHLRGQKNTIRFLKRLRGSFSSNRHTARAAAPE
ncbi:hypothetical protein BGW80DRAFT_1540207 [Lactifluus volemus]|nr:hypothetical protein BGW80DRAFT_1540207 [Lactifluus volemus]